MPKFKLSIMMLLQYMMYAVWWVPLAAYLTNLEVSSTQKALILSFMAIGCMASPLVGMLVSVGSMLGFVLLFKEKTELKK